MGVSLRQIMRLKKECIAEGERGVIHANMGWKLKHATTEETHQQVIRYLRLTVSTTKSVVDFHHLFLW